MIIKGKSTIMVDFVLIFFSLWKLKSKVFNAKTTCMTIQFLFEHILSICHFQFFIATLRVKQDQSTMKINYLQSKILISILIFIQSIYLQCDITGPESGGVLAFTLLIKANNGVGWSGTPWSGQAVNWNWRTSRFSGYPCRWTWKVLIVYVESSITSNTVTCISPYVSVPRLGQYWSHLI